MRKNNAIVLIGSLREKTHLLLESELRSSGITDLAASQGAVLAALYKHDGRLPMKEVARLVRRDKSTVTYLTDRLIDNGYIQKEKDSADKRISYVTLTEKGWGIQGLFREISNRLNETFYSPLSDEEAHLLEQLLEKVDQGFLPTGG
ncbi:MarR family winged helix-turn-helix transcriptional regulator [Alicyclobacillus acidiphilus]|nr:MarR family transcriptional regulator [Alicyclobacillus acidiphilus]